jgi:hypothetical protein
MGSVDNLPYRSRPTEFRLLWVIALAFFVVGDTVTTLALYQHVPTAYEANPIVRSALTVSPVWGMAAVKLAAVCIPFGISIFQARYTRATALYYAPPVMLAVAGAAITTNNLLVLLA